MGIAGMEVVKLNMLEKLYAFENSPKMPVLFVGHGNPMNAILRNKFHQTWQALGKSIARPKAIICISAHWETNGTYITAMEQPRTIHDFGGFPQKLFEQNYPAPGDPVLAHQAKKLIKNQIIALDYEWGLDHGTWSVLLPMFPEADIPVLQLSLDYRKSPAYHYELATKLKPLREKGVLMIGSGNIVHNLGMMKNGNPYDWAVEFNQKIKQFIELNDHQAIIDYQKLGSLSALAVPTMDHYLPMLYALGLTDKNESIQLFNDDYDLGSISMTSVKFG